MGVLLAEFEHGRLHGGGLGLPLLQAGVERDHEILGALVVYVPEAENERLGASLEKSTREADEFVAGCDHVETGGASAEDDEFGGQLEVTEVVKAQMRVAEANRGEHGIVLPEVAVGCDVNDAAGATMGSQDRLCRVLTNEDLRVGKHCAEHFNLGLNGGRLRVGYTENERVSGTVRGL